MLLVHGVRHCHPENEISNRFLEELDIGTTDQIELGRAVRDRLHFIGHQAKALMLENVCRMCEIPDDRHHSNVRDFGNTGTAGPISVLSSKWNDFQGGDHVAILGVGGGLTWSSTLVHYQS